MSPVSASCPSCGAPVVFNVDSSLVTVCKHCQSLVARGDQKLEDLGKLAALSETGAVLEAGMEGKYEDKRFMLTGRTQQKHVSGGVWDEWYAAFNDGRWGWLAEAQGNYYMTFERMAPLEQAPAFDALQLGQKVPGLPSKGELILQEKGEAEAVAAEGEIPYRLVPGERTRYADLSGRGAAFATLDYSVSPPLFFLGKRVTLEEIGIKVRKAPETKRAVAAKALSCPHCGAPLELRAPDKTERVACPYCNSLLDASHGELKFLQALQQPKAKPVIPLGKKGRLDNIEWQHIGFMTRFVNYEGRKYPWEEYLLYNPAHGFRWLVQSEGHWSFGDTVNVAEIDASKGARYASYKSDSFRLFQDGHPIVDGVWGEFYWQVKKGETVASADYVRPPFMLSYEVAKGDRGNEELNWSLLRYLPSSEVKKAFALDEMPSVEGVAPNQPFPHHLGRWWWIFSAVLLALSVMFAASETHTTVFESDFALDVQPNQEATQVFFTDPFPLHGRRNIEVTARSSLQNNWIYVQGDLVEDTTGQILSFDLPLEYYAGVDDGESWSEGSQSREEYYSALPTGNYALRLEVMRGNFATPTVLHVRVREGVARTAHFFLAWFSVSLIPLFTLLRRMTFERKRWSTSDYSPYS